MASSADLQTMNSLATVDGRSAQIQRDVLFMPLIRYDERMNPIPWLAERWDTVRVAPDSLDLTFHLRRDVRWHDGRPTTAEDVLFTFDRAIDSATAFPNASALDQYSRKAKLLDDYTIRFRLRSHSEFLDVWNQTPIMPRHLLEDVPPSQLAQHPFGTARPVGNGPFRFVRHTPGQEWVFEANPDFPKALGGRPYLDRIVYRVIPDQTTLLTELLTGAVQVLIGPSFSHASQIQASPATRLLAAPGSQWTYLAFNLRRPLFRDARVRRAIAMSLNRNQMVQALTFGHAKVGRSTVPPSHWSFDDRSPETLLPYDPDGARRLLAAAGWRNRDQDSTLEDPQGREFRFTIITNTGNDLRRDLLEMIQAQLHSVGIEVRPRLVEVNTMAEQLYGSERDFDAVVHAWVESVRKDDRDILHSSKMNEPYQFVGYSNPRVDTLLDTLSVLTNRDAARPFWREYQRLIVREAPYIPLFYPDQLMGVSRQLKGVVFDGRGEFTSVARWWLDPARR